MMEIRALHHFHYEVDTVLERWYVVVMNVCI
jgi:hypothetical protein